MNNSVAFVAFVAFVAKSAFRKRLQKTTKLIRQKTTYLHRDKRLQALIPLPSPSTLKNNNLYKIVGDFSQQVASRLKRYEHGRIIVMDAPEYVTRRRKVRG